MGTDVPRRRHAAVLAAAALLALALMVAAPQASAESPLYTATNDTWKTECGSCHIAYPPGLLPRRSWRAIMSGLEKHFGTDASLDPATAAEITAFLEKNAGRDRSPRDSAPSLRVTDTQWFRHEHDEVPETVWKNPTVKTAANCIACHTRADVGDFSEQSIRMPQ